MVYPHKLRVRFSGRSTFAGSCRRDQGSGQSNGWCGSGKLTHVQNGFFCVAPVPQPFNCAVCCPRRVVIGHRQFECHTCAAPLVSPAFSHINLVRSSPLPSMMVEPLIVLARRRLFRCPPVVANQHQFYMLEPHVGPVPRVGIAGRRAQTFGRTCGLIGVIGRKMRLAEITCLITCRCH